MKETAEQQERRRHAEIINRHFWAVRGMDRISKALALGVRLDTGEKLSAYEVDSLRANYAKEQAIKTECEQHPEWPKIQAKGQAYYDRPINW